MTLADAMLVTAERLREFVTDKKPVSGLEKLGELDLPAMVVIGEKDAAVPVEQQKMLAKRIPGAKMVVYPEDGHMVTYEQQESVFREIMQFLETIDQGYLLGEANGSGHSG